MNSLEVFYIARQHYQEIIVTSRHQKAAHQRRALEDADFEQFQGLVALTVERDSNEHGGAQAKSTQVNRRLIAENVSFIFQRALAACNCRTG
ncbi:MULTISPECIES: hypothetical protein [unclassified Bradyrhizobium]|uniref:hypothetical protein n=1 Tax=unclassified Bradyrhizobium TaxID=2631580 RepID=UPI001FF74F36|nr:MULTISPECIES: hypothetical protein [unclassified Bradyrhizobium]